MYVGVSGNEKLDSLSLRPPITGTLKMNSLDMQKAVKGRLMRNDKTIEERAPL